MSVSCDFCGETWPRDPALEVPCPWCGAKVGQKCRRPSEHAGGNFVKLHLARDQAALDAGVLKPCPVGPPSSAAATMQPSLFDA